VCHSVSCNRTVCFCADVDFLQCDRARRGRPRAERCVVHILINCLFEMLTKNNRTLCLQLLSDPAENTQALNQQLAALGLYAVQTLGDGNCLFRALSDQYYGSDSKHAQVRQDICDWIATHHSRYAPFVDDERGIQTHLRCMRQHGMIV
jgi:hypothetical protein